MQLSEKGLVQDKAQWEAKGYNLPKYDHEAMVERTKENPWWIHFGAGNIFRAFQANVAQNLLNDGTLDRGIIAVGGSEAMEQLFRPHDNYTVLVTLKADGTVEKTVVGSLAETLTMDAGYEADFERMKEIFTKDSLQMASFTITEKGYSLKGGNGELLPEVAADMANGPAKPESYMGKLTAFLYARYQAGAKPVAMVSMDNCSHNGDVLCAGVEGVAKKWVENGLVEAGFADYLADKEKVSFPWTMLDKITPRPDSAVEAMLNEDDIDDLKPIVTKRSTFIAPFVNAEQSQYLVIEDWFPNGRPALEKGGIIFTARETVDKVERMKVCTCLNPLHTTLAVFGCLLGFPKICDEMKDPTLVKLITKIGYEEGLKVVSDPKVINPKDFIDDVVQVRFPNPFMPDTPERIATDTSKKVGIRFGETIKAYRDSEELDVADLKFIPIVFAGWLRYLKGINDAGNEMACSPDPLLDMVIAGRDKVAFGNPGTIEGIEAAVRPLLEDASIFGVNLYEVGMGRKVCELYAEMMAGPGAVRATLEKYVG